MSSLFLEHLVQGGSQVVHVGVVHRLVAVECPVGVHQVDHGDVTGAVGRGELVLGVLGRG